MKKPISYSEFYNEDKFVEQFIYFTNKSRGKHCTEKHLRLTYQKGDKAINQLIKKLDPTLFYVG